MTIARHNSTLAFDKAALRAVAALCFFILLAHEVSRFATDARKLQDGASFGRPAQSAAAGALGVTTTWQYDKRNLATQIDQIYQDPALSPPTSVRRTFDAYGAIDTEKVYLNGAVKDTWQLTHDALGRRIALKELNYAAQPFSYSYRADGRLAETDFNGAAYKYFYGTDGLLTGRLTPSHTQTIVSRDAVGRITEETQAVNGAVVLDETNFAWRGDSTQGGYTATRAGSWNESRAYGYDDTAAPNKGRGHLVSQTFAPASGQTAALGYHFDSDTLGGLGLRTSIGLTGNLTGSNAASYAAFGRLGNMVTAGSITGPLGTPVVPSYDGMGDVAARAQSAGNDTLTWDALGRLVAVARRDAGNNGFNWSAVYDGLGRRLQTAKQAVSAGTPTGLPLTIQSSFDPDVEFMELAVTVAGGDRQWLVRGPDLNGSYGGLQGTGGTEAIVKASVTTGILSDIYGHTVATVANNTVTTWNPARSEGYGVVPGCTAVALDASHDLTSALAWRGRYVDSTGYYWLGARYYAPDSGTFLSCDPLGHAASMSLYDYCNGDPVNGFDPDGRLGKPSLLSWDGIQQQEQMLSVYGQDSYRAQNGPTYATAYDLATPSQQNSMLMNQVPVVGDLLRASVALSGYDLAAGHSVSAGEQIGATFSTVAALGMVAAPFISVESSAMRTAAFEEASFASTSVPRAASLPVAAKTVGTPYGPAVQSMTAEARAALSQVENGATLYKGGVLGRSETGASQFLSLESPLNPGYAGRYGIPPQNANFEFILTGKVQPGASVITRPAPGIPPNPGGGIEAVTTPGSFRLDSFYMP